MPAKPVVDLAVGVAAEQVGQAVHELARLGFDVEGERPGHVWLSYPNRSARAFVVHVLEFDGAEWHRRLRFRDILIVDERQRSKYMAAKLAAAAAALGWGDYTRIKAPVVADILETYDIPIN